jgi:sulfatase modifying factor 1
MRTFAPVFLSVVFAAPSGAVMIDWVTVGDPRNEPDVTGFGSVPYTYQIGKYEVTNAEYAEFLNAVAADDPNELYNISMRLTAEGGIRRAGDPGSYVYSLLPGRENKPITYASFWDALRFANWLHNGQPVGLQGPDTTEDGAYTLTAESIANNTITRNRGATAFMPSENEWYKAAYYKGGGPDAGYWLYPTRSDEPPVDEPPPGGSNSANLDLVLATQSDVGAYAESSSAYGTFDQAGNLREWNEAISDAYPERRMVRGGSYADTSGPSSMARGASFVDFETSVVGFRVARIPEPGTVTTLSAGLLAIGAWRRWGARWAKVRPKKSTL